MTDVAIDDCSVKQHELLFGVRKSVRYHARRRQFFDRLSKAITIFTTIGGIGTVTAVLAKASPGWTLAYGALAGVASIVDIVIGCAEAARRHSDLAREFIQLERDIIRGGNLSEGEITNLTCRRLEIEEEEPTVLRVLDLQCHNELCRALGYESCHEVKLTWYQRLFAQYFDSGMGSIARAAEQLQKK